MTTEQHQTTARKKLHQLFVYFYQLLESLFLSLCLPLFRCNYDECKQFRYTKYRLICQILPRGGGTTALMFLLWVDITNTHTQANKLISTVGNKCAWQSGSHYAPRNALAYHHQDS